MFEHFYLSFYFQETLKKKAEYLSRDNNDKLERHRQKNDISANEQLNTLVTECCKNDANTGRSAFWAESFEVCRTLGTKYL